MTRLPEREEQAKVLASGDIIDPNPLDEAESFPSRFITLSYFFDEGDGVEIVQDSDNEERDPEIYYFDESGRTRLTSGALYEWTLEKWEEEEGVIA